MIPIAFGHRKSVGKNTAAKFLMSGMRTKGSTKQIQKGSFAYSLKVIAHKMYYWAGLKAPSYYEDNYHEREVILPAVGKSPRDIWIELGIAGRSIHNTTWIDILFHNMKDVDILIITDLRFPNEADYVKSKGGLIIRIDRPDVEDTSDPADDALIGYQGWDDVIQNTTMDDFYQEIMGLVERFKL